MNALDHASIEASRRLVDNGIVLETDSLWGCMYVIQEKEEWYIREDRDDFIRGMPTYPAPSMAEAWRELPIGTTIIKGVNFNTCLKDFNDKHWYDTNPADALIDLLIWVRKEKV